MKRRTDPINCLCFNGEIFIGNHEEFLAWAQKNFQYDNFRSVALYDAIAEEAYKDYFLKNKV